MAPDKSEKGFDDVTQRSLVRNQNIFGIIYFLVSVAVLFPMARLYITSILDNRQHQSYIFLLITLSSIFPISAIAYKLFQGETQKRILGNDLWLLGVPIPDGKGTERRTGSAEPHVEPTKEDYQNYADKLHLRSYGFWHFAAYSILSIYLTFIGVSLFFMTPSEMGLLMNVNNGDVLQAMRYGFIGAYIYSMQLIYRRYTTLDLQPSVYLYCAITLIAGVAFNFIAFKAIGDMTNATTSVGSTGLASGLIAVIAFSLGYFPSLAIRWFNRLTLSALGQQDRRSNLLPLSLIDGISDLHETRLNDKGIDNIQNLATTNLVELITNTRFSAQAIIDWIDQAVLYTYLDMEEIGIFRHAGVRTYTDFKDQWGKYCPWNENEATSPTTMIDPVRKADAAKNFMSTPERLDALYTSMRTGPNVQYIENYWYRCRLEQWNEESSLQTRFSQYNALPRTNGSKEAPADPDMKDNSSDGATTQTESLPATPPI